MPHEGKEGVTYAIKVPEGPSRKLGVDCHPQPTQTPMGKQEKNKPRINRLGKGTCEVCQSNSTIKQLNFLLSPVIVSLVGLPFMTVIPQRKAHKICSRADRANRYIAALTDLALLKSLEVRHNKGKVATKPCISNGC